MQGVREKSINIWVGEGESGKVGNFSKELKGQGKPVKFLNIFYDVFSKALFLQTY